MSFMDSKGEVDYFYNSVGIDDTYFRFVLFLCCHRF